MEVVRWILRNCRIAGGFESLRERGLYFWQKPKVAKAFRFCVVESRGNRRICEVDSTDFVFLRGRFCGIVESLVKLKSKREGRFYFWQKPKVAKTFTHCVRDFAILHFVCEILRFAEFNADSVLWNRGGIVESVRWILRFCGFCVGFYKSAEST